MRDFVTSSGVTMVKARRAHSLPSTYNNAFVLPSDEMGEYDEVGGVSRRRSAPAKGSGMLYPLREEGTYGAPPTAPAPPKEYVRRERKPKVYSSYAVNKECHIHGGDKLAKAERDHGVDHEMLQRRRRLSSSSSASRKPSWASRASPAPPSNRSRRTVSASPSRRTSASPEPTRKNSGRMPG